MRLYVDLDTNRITEGIGIRQAASLVEIKVRDTEPVEFIFFRQGVAQELGSGALGQFGIKAQDDYQGDYLAFSGTWAKSGSGADTVYTFTPAFNESALLALFSTDTEYVEAVLEVSWIVDGATSSSAQHTACRIWQDIVQDDTPTPVPVVASIDDMDDAGFYELGGELYWVPTASATPIKLS